MPAIIHDGAVSFSPYSVLGTANIRRDLQSALGMPVSIFGIGGCLVADACRMGAARDANLVVGMWIGKQLSWRAGACRKLDHRRTRRGG